MAVSSESINELNGKCGLPSDECRTSLEEHAGDVEAALAALIDAGRIKPYDLNPQTVSDELFTRAVRYLRLESFRRDAKADAGLAAFGKKSGMTGTKTPEQMLVEYEEKEVARLALAGVNPPTIGEKARREVRTTRRREWVEAHPYALHLPPFPPLKMKLREWEGQDLLPTWAGTQARQGGYTPLSSDEPSNGSFSLLIPRLCEDDANPRPPAPEQVAAYAYLQQHEAEITDSVLLAVLIAYAKVRPKLFEQMSDPDELPEIQSIDEIRKHVGLGTLHMFEVAKDGYAYFGLELGCTWDEEHGTGVILHRGRVVEIGSADTSFDRHPAIVDGGVKIPGGAV